MQSPGIESSFVFLTKLNKIVEQLWCLNFEWGQGDCFQGPNAEYKESTLK